MRSRARDGRQAPSWPRQRGSTRPRAAKGKTRLGGLALESKVLKTLASPRGISPQGSSGSRSGVGDQRQDLAPERLVETMRKRPSWKDAEHRGHAPALVNSPIRVLAPAARLAATQVP